MTALSAATNHAAGAESTDLDFNDLNSTPDMFEAKPGLEPSLPEGGRAHCTHFAVLLLLLLLVAVVGCRYIG